MTKSELIRRIAHKQPQLVERDVTLAVRLMPAGWRRSLLAGITL